MQMYTDRVPYLGLVDWDEPQIRDYARELAAAHRPLRWRGRCRVCGTKSPCYPAQWSAGTLLDERREQVDVHAVLALIGVLVGMAVFVVVALW